MGLFAGYEGAARCTTGPSPGAKALMAWFLGEYGKMGGVNLGIFNCLSGETLVTTPHGDVPIADLAGTTARLLTLDLTRERFAPRWVDSPIRSYGIQTLRQVTLRRGTDEQVLYATPEHRWLTRYRRSGSDGGGWGHVDRTTDTLGAGHVVPTVFPRSGASRIRHLGAGVPHGLVYGDGSIDTTGGSRIMLCTEKKLPLAEHFPNVPTHHGHNENGEPFAVITGLSRTWKRLPSVEESSAYLYGFLAGWFAADGRVTENGAAQLYCSDRDALEAVRVLARRIGISTFPIRTSKSGGNVVAGNWLEQRDIYSLTYVGKTLDSSFFLQPAHRERWNEAPRRRRPDDWRVVSVEPTDRVEEVYCAEVSGTENFVLAEGVLTGNCRAVRGGTTTSLHGEGRAVDLGINPHSAPWGSELAELLRTNSAELGIQCVIWDRRIWSGSQPHAGWRPYRGVNPHRDHIHAELSWGAARGLTAAGVAGVLRGGGTAQPSTPNPTGGDDDMAAWDAILPDYYTANARDGLPAGEMVAWGTAHAAAARDAARDAAARVAALETKLDALMTRVVSGGPIATGGATLSDDDLDRIAARVVALLGHKTST